MELPAPVTGVVEALLRDVDAVTPGLVEGFYLTGSVAMGDFRTGRGPTRWAPSGAARSDVDFVAVTAGPVDERAAAALAAAHGRRRPGPPLEGVYLTAADLARDPAEVGGLAHTHGGRFDRGGAGSPVLWQEMAQHAVAVRGRHRDELEIRTDPDALRAWVRGNLDGYWRRWHAGCARALSPAGVLGLTHWIPVWGVLGVARMRYTLDTGLVCAKTAGGRYAAEVVDPHWHRILDECVRIRTSRPGRPRYRDPLARRRDALGFVAMIANRG